MIRSMDNNLDKSNQIHQQSFTDKPLQNVEGGWRDEMDFYHTPNGSFWDSNGIYFNRNGFDSHGGRYDEDYNYIPGEGWNEENQCYESELIKYLAEENFKHQMINLLENSHILTNDHQNLNDYDPTMISNFDKKTIENFKDNFETSIMINNTFNIENSPKIKYENPNINVPAFVPLKKKEKKQENLQNKEFELKINLDNVILLKSNPLNKRNKQLTYYVNQEGESVFVNHLEYYLDNEEDLEDREFFHLEFEGRCNNVNNEKEENEKRVKVDKIKIKNVKRKIFKREKSKMTLDEFNYFRYFKNMDLDYVSPDRSLDNNINEDSKDDFTYQRGGERNFTKNFKYIRNNLENDPEYKSNKRTFQNKETKENNKISQEKYSKKVNYESMNNNNNRSRFDKNTHTQYYPKEKNFDKKNLKGNFNYDIQILNNNNFYNNQTNKQNDFKFNTNKNEKKMDYDNNLKNKIQIQNNIVLQNNNQNKMTPNKKSTNISKMKNENLNQTVNYGSSIERGQKEEKSESFPYDFSRNPNRLNESVLKENNPNNKDSIKYNFNN